MRYSDCTPKVPTQAQRDLDASNSDGSHGHACNYWTRMNASGKNCWECRSSGDIPTHTHTHSRTNYSLSITRSDLKGPRIGR